MIRTQATVALGGDGSDELFGGYPHYSWIQQQDRIRRVLGPARSVAHINLYFDARLRAALLRPLGIHAPIEAEAARASMLEADSSPLRMAYTLDFDNYMADDILVKVDRASMLASLEVRAPFLDHRVIEFAFGRGPGPAEGNPPGAQDPAPEAGGTAPAPDTGPEPEAGVFPAARAMAAKGSVAYHGGGCAALRAPGTVRSEYDKHAASPPRPWFDNAQRLFALTMFELWRRTYDAEVTRNA